MKIKPEQLSAKLKSDPRPLVWISGDEPLFVLERADSVRQFCQQAGTTERDVFNVDRSFDWGHFSEAAGNLSLFSESRLIELRLATAKLEDDGKQALANYVESPNPDYQVLITSPRLDAATLRTRWFKTLDKAAWYVPVWPLSKDELPDWLQQRLLRVGLRARPDALQLLIERVEGNLLAANQEINKLALLADTDGKTTVELDIETVLESVGDSARFNPFTLIDAALEGDVPRAVRILHGLRGEGTEPLAIVGALGAELRRLYGMARLVQAGQPARRVVDEARINFKRARSVTAALQRIGPPHIFRLLDQLRNVDYAVKGLNRNDPWLSLETLVISMSGTAVPALQRTG